MIKNRFIFTVVVILAGTFIEGCQDTPKVHAVGVAANLQREALILEGLKQGLADFGYQEGKNLKFNYENIVDEQETAIIAQTKELLALENDILFVAGAAGGYIGDFLKETNLPVLFCGDPDPVGHGIVASVIHPGGNITGVKAIDGIQKTLEWLTLIKPGLKRVWMPYDPDDPFASFDASGAEKASVHLDISLSLHPVHSVEETVEAILELPQDIDAILVNPSRALFPGSDRIMQAAIDRGLPTGSSVETVDTVLLVLSTDNYKAGKMAARLAHQIIQGIKPSQLPVETPEAVLTINLNTAEKIGLVIPSEVLLNANKIIR